MFKISLNGANEGNEKLIALDKSPTFEYDNEKGAYTEKISGVQYDVILQSNRYQQLSVKIKGEDPLPKLSTEDIQAANDSGSPILLIFKGGEVKFSVSNGYERLSATATSVAVAPKASAPVSTLNGFGTPPASPTAKS